MNGKTEGCSKILTKKWQNKDLQRHLRNLSNVKSTISLLTATGSSSTPSLPALKSQRHTKKYQLQQGI